MAGRSFLTLRGDSLTDGQRRTLLKLACVLAWADGVLVEAEQMELGAALEELGGIRRSEFQRVGDSCRSTYAQKN